MTDRTRKQIAAAFHVVVGVATALPLLVSSAGLSEAIPVVGGALYVARLITRLVASQAVQRLLPAWLRTDR